MYKRREESGKEERDKREVRKVRRGLFSSVDVQIHSYNDNLNSQIINYKVFLRTFLGTFLGTILGTFFGTHIAVVIVFSKVDSFLGRGIFPNEQQIFQLCCAALVIV